MMKPGSKYYPLYQYLQQQRDRSAVTLSFEAIEALLQASLPPSARRQRAWWSNRNTRALQAAAWISAGYQTAAVDLAKQQVTFRPFQAEYNLQHRDGEMVWNPDAIRALRKHMGLTQAQFAQNLGVRRQTVSEWENGLYDPDRSTAKHLALIAQNAQFAIAREGDGAD